MTTARDHIVMTEDEFLDRFKPRPNHIHLNASFDFGNGGCLYETFGAELAFVRAQPVAHIWTLVEEDGRLFVISGYHLVNRLGYLLTEQPVAVEEAITIPVV